MRKNDAQLGTPGVLYKNTKANVEALSGIAEGAIAYATDDNEFGTYNGTTWDWGQGGSGSGGAFQRVLSASLTLADGECLIISEYLDMGPYDLSLNGDGNLYIL